MSSAPDTNNVGSNRFPNADRSLALSVILLRLRQHALPRCFRPPRSTLLDDPRHLCSASPPHNACHHFPRRPSTPPSQYTTNNVLKGILSGLLRYSDARTLDTKEAAAIRSALLGGGCTASELDGSARSG